MTWLLFRPYPGEHTWAAPADRYLVASIRIPRSGLEPAPAAPSAAPADDPMRLRVASLQDDLARRLMSEPGVRGSTFSDQPAGEEADERLVRVDGQPATSIGVATFVHPSFFAVLGVPPVSGRLFDAGDVSFDPAAAPTAVAVNMTFLERLGMDPRRAVGRRIRFTDAEDRDPGPWMEIVGVVPNIEPSEARADIDGTPAVFVPATPGTLNPMTLTIDLGRRPLAFEPRLRSLLGEADPSAILSDVYALDRLPVETNVFSIGIGVMTGISLLAILLSTTALYALMSMTVAQRKREFGIRLALGGSTGAVMAAVARRALVQIALGVAWGTGFWVAVMSWAMSRVPARGPGETLALWPYVLAAAAVVVIALALVGSLGPTLRCVRRRPIDTLRVDA
jgi:putative ABC transport system permease protein